MAIRYGIAVGWKAQSDLRKHGKKMFSGGVCATNVHLVIFIHEFHGTRSDRKVASIKRQREIAVADLRPQNPSETEQDWYRRMKPDYLRMTRYACGFSGTPLMKFFKEIAAMIKIIEEPGWAFNEELRSMSAVQCLEIGRVTETLEA